MHRIGALHGSDRRCDDCPAGITERLAGFQIRMFADNAVASDFLNFAIGIGNQPMTLKQLGRYFADIGDSDGVGEDIAPLIGRGLRLYKMRRGFNYYFVFFRSLLDHIGYMLIISS